MFTGSSGNSTQTSGRCQTGKIFFKDTEIYNSIITVDFSRKQFSIFFLCWSESHVTPSTIGNNNEANNTGFFHVLLHFLKRNLNYCRHIDGVFC